MSRADYDRWVAAGKPFTLMRPARDLRDRLRAHGYTVYDIGNQSHLLAEPPEDHTPYSDTGWPGTAHLGVGYAVDIMPSAAGATSRVDGLPLPSLQQLGAQLLEDREAAVRGISWLKYMNWEPQRDNGGACWHDSWQPAHVRRSSGDRGHIHLSGVTGLESSTIGAGYDPVARIRGGDDVSAADVWNTQLVDPADKSQHKAGDYLRYLEYNVIQQLAPVKAVLAAQSAALAAIRLGLEAGADVDEQAIIAGVLAGLTPEKIAAAIPPELADQVVDALAARIAG